MFFFRVASLFFLTLPAIAGTITEGVTICGTTSIYSRYGKPATALIATAKFEDPAEKPIKGFFRLQSSRYVTKDWNFTKNSEALARADYIAATRVKGVYMCAAGNLERKTSTCVGQKGCPEQESLYFYPVSFRIKERTNAYLNPSEVIGKYEGEVFIPKVETVLEPAFNFTMMAAWTSDHWAYFESKELSNLLAKDLAIEDCKDLDIGFTIDRKSTIGNEDKAQVAELKRQLDGAGQLYCSGKPVKDLVNIALKFEKSPADGKVLGSVLAENLKLQSSIQIDFTD